MSTNAAIDPLALEWSFGDRMRKIRRASGLNQDDFGARIGQSSSSISAWESGRNEQPRGIVAIAKRIELAYGVSAAWVLGLSRNPRPGDQDAGLPRLDSNQEPAEDQLDNSQPLAPVIPLHPLKKAS